MSPLMFHAHSHISRGLEGGWQAFMKPAEKKKVGSIVACDKQDLSKMVHRKR